MRINPPIVRVLKKVKTSDGVSAFEALIHYLYDIEKMTVPEVASILGIGEGVVYKVLRKGRDENDKTK